MFTEKIHADIQEWVASWRDKLPAGVEVTVNPANGLCSFMVRIQGGMFWIYRPGRVEFGTYGAPPRLKEAFTPSLNHHPISGIPLDVFRFPSIGFQLPEPGLVEFDRPKDIYIVPEGVDHRALDYLRYEEFDLLYGSAFYGESQDVDISTVGVWTDPPLRRKLKEEQAKARGLILGRTQDSLDYYKFGDSVLAQACVRAEYPDLILDIDEQNLRGALDQNAERRLAVFKQVPFDFTARKAIFAKAQRETYIAIGLFADTKSKLDLSCFAEAADAARRLLYHQADESDIRVVYEFLFGQPMPSVELLEDQEGYAKVRVNGVDVFRVILTSNYAKYEMPEKLRENMDLDTLYELRELTYRG